ncbi:MAG: substrate-binding domain-containing protein [Cyanobacteria bacterium P01_D01_bin.156]
MRYKPTWIGILAGLMLTSAGCSSTANTAAIKGTQGTITQNPTPDNIQAAPIIRLVGASTPYPAMQLLSNTYELKANNIQIAFLDSSQSSGGIAAVKSGLAEIGTVTRPPKPEESSRDLSYREIAKDALLVAVHQSVKGINDLTTQDLKAIYSGQVTNWKVFGGPDAEIIVLDRAEDTSAKRLLRKHYLGDSLKNSPNSILLRREADLVEALQNTPHSIGVVSLAKTTSENLSVNIITLDGIAPNAENLKSNRYVMHRTLGIVWYGTPSNTSQEFIDFILSETSSNILSQSGFVPSFTD